MITGYLLSDRYQVGDVIGQGGMSVVLRSRDVRLDRDVAVKVLRSDLLGDPKYAARFRHEARNAASLNHPAIVGVYDTGFTDDERGLAPYIVMEYVQGETLRALIDRGGPLAPRRAMEIAADILAALDFSHRHGILHRGVSPKHVMLDSTGAVKVMDFGIAGPMPAGADSTITASMVHAARYLAPEQARGDPVDARSDVYSVGCLLYEMLTGAPPFTAASPVAVAQQHVREAPRPPSEREAGLDPAIDAIVLTALAKSPLNRYQTAAEMRSALTQVLAGQPSRAARPDVNARAGGAPTSRPVAGGSPPLLAPPLSSLPDETWDPEPASVPRRAWGFIGIGLLCVLVLVGASWLTLKVITSAPPPAPVAVPDLSGKTVDEATVLLRDKKLTMGSVTPVDSDDASVGHVVHQRPSSLTQVDENTTVNVEIGRGVTLVAVPNLVGSSSESAQKTLAQAHLVYAEQLGPSSDADRGKVVAQSADAQSQVAPNSTITVTVGTGIALVTVPDGIIGQNLDEATQILQAANFTVVAQEGDGTEPVNQVIGMDAQPGRQIPEGTPVTLTYSNNALMVMPPLQSQNADKAVSTLQRLGWAGDADSLSVTAEATPNPALIGSVVTQEPAAGSVVPKIGTPVRIGVGVKQLTMPNLVGKTQNQAADLLRQAGATNVTFADAGAAPRGQAGRIKTQSPPPGSAVTAETAIVLSVYRN